MYALLVPVEIVLGPEAFCSSAIFDIAPKRLVVFEIVFPVSKISWITQPIRNG